MADARLWLRAADVALADRQSYRRQDWGLKASGRVHAGAIVISASWSDALVGLFV